MHAPLTLSMLIRVLGVADLGLLMHWRLSRADLEEARAWTAVEARSRAEAGGVSERVGAQSRAICRTRSGRGWHPASTSRAAHRSTPQPSQRPWDRPCLRPRGRHCSRPCARARRFTTARHGRHVTTALDFGRLRCAAPTRHVHSP